MKKHNFGAGPCILPQSVFAEASKAVVELDGAGLSILEISHRSSHFVDIMEEARSLVKEVLGVPQGYTVLFLQGGASLGFLISAMNAAGSNRKGAYIDTGAWANKAVKEGKNAGLQVEVVGSSKDSGYNHIPKGPFQTEGFDFLHYTSNNTIYGTQFHSVPETDARLVCDMSSDIFSKPVDVSKFDLIYAGAQKNLGPAGATLYIVKDELLGTSPLDIPTYLDLKVHADKDSMFNTPPVYSIYVSMLNLRWLKANGGIDWIQERNAKKAQVMYDAIDASPIFNGACAPEDRSQMNLTFIWEDGKEGLKEEFDRAWNDAGIVGLKGHRSVGGYRASMYNALDVESAQVLADLITDFSNKKG